MATRIKISRKDLKKPDEFLSITTRAMMYAVDHSKQVLSYAAVLAFMGLAAIIVFFYFNQRESKSQLLLSQGISTYRQGMLFMEGRSEKADVDRNKGLSLLKTALEIFDKVSKQYSGTQTGKIALFYAGYTNIQLGQDGKAIEAFDKYLSIDGQPELREIALYQIAWSYEQQNNYDKALHYYTNLSEINNNMFVGYDYEAMARCYGKIGKPDLAKRALEQGIERLQGTKASERLKTLIELVK